VTVEVNHQFRRPLFPVEHRDSETVGGVRSRNTAIVSFPELAAGKLCALLDRCEARDVFDVAELASRIAEDADRVRLAVVVLSAASRSLDLRRCRPWVCPLEPGRLADWARDGVLSATGPEDGDWRAWAVRLSDRTASTVDLVLRLAESETAFLSDLLDRGLVSAERLSDEPALAAVIARHPAVVWRATNVRDHIARGTARSAK
jgi:hypothetical protein